MAAPVSTAAGDGLSRVQNLVAGLRRASLLDHPAAPQTEEAPLYPTWTEERRRDVNLDDVLPWLLLCVPPQSEGPEAEQLPGYVCDREALLDAEARASIFERQVYLRAGRDRPPRIPPPGAGVARVALGDVDKSERFRSHTEFSELSLRAISQIRKFVRLRSRSWVRPDTVPSVQDNIDLTVSPKSVRVRSNAVPLHRDRKHSQAAVRVPEVAPAQAASTHGAAKLLAAAKQDRLNRAFYGKTSGSAATSAASPQRVDDHDVEESRPDPRQSFRSASSLRKRKSSASAGKGAEDPPPRGGRRGFVSPVVGQDEDSDEETRQAPPKKRKGGDVASKVDQAVFKRKASKPRQRSENKGEDDDERNPIMDHPLLQNCDEAMVDTILHEVLEGDSSLLFVLRLCLPGGPRVAKALEAACLGMILPALRLPRTPSGK
jgi:hypothetical protein